LSFAMANRRTGGLSFVSLHANGLVKKIWYAIILWLEGFVWGMIIFIAPLNRASL